MKGNLNYAFENMNECQERENNLDNNFNFTENLTLSIEENKLETRSNHTVDENNFAYNMKNEDTTDIDKEKIKMEVNCPDDKSHVENVEDSLDYGVEIIELLDQVLKDEEEAFGGVNDSYEINDTFNSLYPTNHIDDENFSNHDTNIETVNDDSTHDKISVHNVVAIVHREDEFVENDEGKGVNDIETEEITETSTLEPLEDKYNELKTQTLTPETIEDISKIESLESNQNFFIPKPPPMDENFFATPVILPFKSKTMNYKKVETKKFIENEQLQEGESSVDDSHIKITSDFQKKLSVILGSHGTNPQVQRRLTRGAFREPSTDNENVEKSSQLKRNISEPNLVNISKSDSSNNQNADDKPFIENKESLSMKNDFNVDKHNISHGNNQAKSENHLHNNDSIFDHDDEPKSIAEIKAMLNKVLVSGPINQKPKKNEVKVPKNVETHESDPELVEEIITPRKSHDPNYTKTMKLQRARFENVLKSFQQEQNKRESFKSGNIEINQNISKPNFPGNESNASNADTNSDR